VLECATDIADEILDLVVTHMTAAWTEMFPQAPSLGIVDARTSLLWAKEE
jgi:hypothetical protein